MIKLGNLDINSFKVGSADCAVYLGTVKLYPTTPPSFNGKYKFTLTDDSVVSGECDASSAITTAETSAYLPTLKEAVLGDCVTSISIRAFSTCTSLTSITIQDSVTSIGNYAFASCESLTSCTIGSGVTSIGDNAFYICTSLPSIVIPHSVTSIGQQAFRECTSLTSIDIPYSVTSIEQWAFSDCSGLTSCTIGSGVTSIGSSAFRRCSGLASFTCLAITPPALGDNAFLDTNSNLLIYVPSGSVSAYQSTSGWSTYANKIQAIPS